MNSTCHRHGTFWICISFSNIFSSGKDLTGNLENWSFASSKATSFFNCLIRSFSEMTWVLSTFYEKIVVTMHYRGKLCLDHIFFLTMFIWARLVISFAQDAKNSVFRVCSTCLCDGLIVQIIAVRALPPSEYCKIRVSFESL